MVEGYNYLDEVCTGFVFVSKAIQLSWFHLSKVIGLELLFSLALSKASPVFIPIFIEF